MDRIRRNLHLFGRYGITMFAISGLDIALWDLAARVKDVPLHPHRRKQAGADSGLCKSASQVCFGSGLRSLLQVNARRRYDVATPQLSCMKRLHQLYSQPVRR